MILPFIGDLIIVLYHFFPQMSRRYIMTAKIKTGVVKNTCFCDLRRLGLLLDVDNTGEKRRLVSRSKLLVGHLKDLYRKHDAHYGIDDTYDEAQDRENDLKNTVLDLALHKVSDAVGCKDR